MSRSQTILHYRVMYCENLRDNLIEDALLLPKYQKELQAASEKLNEVLTTLKQIKYENEETKTK